MSLAGTMSDIAAGLTQDSAEVRTQLDRILKDLEAPDAKRERPAVRRPQGERPAEQRATP